MHFKVELEELQNILKLVRVCVKSNTTDPAGRISIFVSPDEVTFITSDVLNSIKVKLTNPTIQSEGTCSLLYKDLQPFIQSFHPYTEDRGGVELVEFKLNPKSVSVSLENNLAGGKVSKHRVRLAFFDTLNEDGLFDVPNTDFVLSSSVLKTSLDKVNFIVDPAHNITFLRGVNLKFTENEIYFAGTNGIVISEQTIKNTSALSDAEYILSHSFVKALRNTVAFLSKEEVSVAFSIVAGKVRVVVDTVILVGNLIINYEFPDYRPELLKSKKHVVKLDKELLMTNLNAIINLLDPEDNYRITIEYTGNILKLTSDGSESEFPIEGEACDVVKVDLNGRFLKQVINSIQDDQLLVKLTDENTPVLFDSEMFEDQKALITYIKRRSE